MTVAELQEAKRLGIPVILKADWLNTREDIRYNKVLAIVMRRVKGKQKPVAVLECPCGHSVTYADPSRIVRE